jgi:hypothetical protein
MNVAPSMRTRGERFSTAAATGAGDDAADVATAVIVTGAGLLGPAQAATTNKDKHGHFICGFVRLPRRDSSSIPE